MFSNDDILTLAKAGFTAQQIAALNQVGAAPVPPQTGAETIHQEAETSNPAPAPESVTAPVQVPPQDNAKSASSIDDVLAAVNGIGKTIQNGFLLNTEQPKPVTAEDVLASIINPPSKDNK